MSRIKEIHYTLDFKKSYEKLPKNLQRIVDRKDALFRKNPFHPSLNTHKLKGPLKDLGPFMLPYLIVFYLNFLTEIK